MFLPVYLGWDCGGGVYGRISNFSHLFAFDGSCRRMVTPVIVEQKNPILYHTAFSILHQPYSINPWCFNAFWPRTQRITARRSAALQFGRCAVIFKEDVRTNTALTKPDTDSSRQCVLYSYWDSRVSSQPVHYSASTGKFTLLFDSRSCNMTKQSVL